jgi:hypothetical protein
MALRLVIGACSNEYVAGWALQSMGGELATQTRREAARQGKPPGRFVAEIVRDFERTSDFAARANAARSPISLYWPGSASSSLTALSICATSRGDNIIPRLADHEAKAMIGA